MRLAFLLVHFYIWICFFFDLYCFTIAPGVDYRYCEHHQPTILTSANKTSDVPHEVPQENKEETFVLQKIVRRVLHHILIISRFGQLPTAMCYDCACTLKLFIKRHFGSDNLKSTSCTQFLTSLTMAVDRFHVKNHTRPMCKTVMRPDHSCHNDIYASINTEVAEQMFSYLSQFKHSFRGYNYPKSGIFYTILFHLKNCKTTAISSYEQRI